MEQNRVSSRGQLFHDLTTKNAPNIWQYEYVRLLFSIIVDKGLHFWKGILSKIVIADKYNVV